MYIGLVLVHSKLGVYLGVGPYGCVWSSSSAGVTRAATFRTYYDADTFARIYIYEHDVDGDYLIKEVECASRMWATHDECVAAGIGKWETRSQKQILIDTQYH